MTTAGTVTPPATVPGDTIAPRDNRSRLNRRSPAGRVVTYALLLLFLVIVLMPAYVLVVTSFKSGREIGVNGQWSLPAVWTFDSWAKAWTALGPSFVRT